VVDLVVYKHIDGNWPDFFNHSTWFVVLLITIYLQVFSNVHIDYPLQGMILPFTNVDVYL